MQAPVTNKVEENCSIIIPFRNEEENLVKLIQSLLSVDFPKENFEVVFVDDHSEDNSSKIVKKAIDENPNLFLKLLSLEKGQGKKEAIALAIAEAEYDIILQTDADCIVLVNWIREMMTPFVNNRVSAVLGKVQMVSNGSILGDLMALEFTSLQASGISLAIMKVPIMSNGANMAYRKSRMPVKVPGENWASGDDAFLIQSLSKKDKESVEVNLNSKVITKVPKSLKEFLKQRLRWGSKTPDYPLQQGKWISILVFLTCLAQVIIFAITLWNPLMFALCGLIYLLKAIPDYLLIDAYLKNQPDKNLLKWIPLLSLIYPFYISFTALYIIVGTSGIKWKDRPIRH